MNLTSYFTSFTSYDEATKYITDECLSLYQTNDRIQPTKLAMHLMEFPGLKMHCPQHHYLISAVMLTAVFKGQGRAVEMLRDGLTEAMLRAKNVLPGFCGLYGSCGAAVGLGIFGHEVGYFVECSSGVDGVTIF
jgi:hypothetical protein